MTGLLRLLPSRIKWLAGELNPNTQTVVTMNRQCRILNLWLSLRVRLWIVWSYR